ncbi:MAG TPA: hypothetical protein DDW84_07525 [Phycisphaerales bacterium]|nr:MAG: hypothetical protein A2Y13_10085 [Planctomycetes bacterium GWC2_45_44]HBG78673.1 hypothetical protein [Phycisphaerales bacterium]HBR18601.1 hypothetical protein [Phycisphaerales bacterium]
MKHGIVIMAAICCISICAISVRADEMADLKQQIAELQQKVAAVEAKQTQQQVQVDERITKLAEKQSSVPDSLKWAEKIKFSGDFRYRHESINSQSSGTEQAGRNSNRFRARIGIGVKINEDWDLGFRLATGSSADPSSTNQSLDNGFAKKSVWIDQAYFDWHPKQYEKRLNIYGGKMPNPFYRAGNNQLVWDDDVNPEGIAAKYVMPLPGTGNNLYINGGGFWLRADEGGTASTSGASVFGIQSYVKHDFENKNYMLGGLSYYTFGNIEGKNGLYSTTSKYGNTMTGAGTTASPYKYSMNYNVLEAFGEYGFKFADKPTTVYGSYVKNLEAATSKSTGWLIGTTFNKAKEPKSWELGYNYRNLQADAVLGLLTDSDFVGGGTNGKGHCFSGKYQFTRNIQGGLTYYLSQKGDAGDAYRRLMADIIFKF